MAGLAAEANSSPNCAYGPSPVPSCKSNPPENSAKKSPLNPPLRELRLVYARYLDHVLYNRALALSMKPQIREAVGWLVYECEQYVIVAWDRDAQPPTLHGGDPKASGLVLLKSDIVALERLRLEAEPPQEKSEWHINSPNATVTGEYAFRPTERKTQKKRMAT